MSFASSLTRTLAPLALIASLTSACALADDTGASVGAPGAHSMSAWETALVLDLINYPGTDFDVLDQHVRIDRRAAANIIAHRNGHDGITPSGDDQLFGNLEQLLAVHMVGPATLEKLRLYALDFPPPAGELVAGLEFSGWEAEAVVWGANRADVDELLAIGVNSRSARNLVDGAPYRSVEDIGEVYWVGPATLARLRDHAAVWWHRSLSGGERGMGGTYDGVLFDDVTAEAALDIANFASYGQLTAEAGMWSTGAQRIIDARLHRTLAEVADTDGVGTATMQALHDYAASGRWSPPQQQ
jgi:DNA uptake protein ComE-like DNA-binding protein